MIEAVRSYLAMFSAPPETEAERLRALAAALSRLDYVYHSAADLPFVHVDDRPPLSDYKATCTTIARTFPKFGFYAVVALDPDPDAKVMMGDAVDDLADIALELEEVECYGTIRGHRRLPGSSSSATGRIGEHICTMCGATFTSIT